MLTNMKKIYLLLFIFLFSQYVNAQVCTAPTFTTQQQIDNFKIQNPGCKTISGSVTISGADITNLNGLSNISTITGSVMIANNTVLSNLTGLGSLEEVVGRLTIINNPSLLNVNGLGALTNIYDGINVESNQSLTDLSGLQSLAYVGTYLRVVYNPVLTSVEVFNRITSVTDFLSVGANPLLESLSGLHNISSAHSVSIALNDKLLNLDGLRSLSKTTDYLYIGNNAMLNDLQGLRKLKSIAFYLKIFNNDELTTLQGLDSLQSAAGIVVEQNNKLSACAVKIICENLSFLPGQFGILSISSNASGCNSQEEIGIICSSLPATLISFSGESKAEGNVLKWTTASETNNKGFEVENSSNGRLFQKIGFVDGNTDSQQKLVYSFTDAVPHSLTYYRLKQIDWDGTSTYSRIINVKAKEQAVAVYPNPSRGHLTIRAKNRNQPYSIKNNQGITVMESTVLPDKEITTDSLQDGIYFLTVGSEVFKVLVAND